MLGHVLLVEVRHRVFDVQYPLDLLREKPTGCVRLKLPVMNQDVSGPVRRAELDAIVWLPLRITLKHKRRVGRLSPPVTGKTEVKVGMLELLRSTTWYRFCRLCARARTL